MINSNSGKHARKVTLDAAVSNAIAKAVDARKVAAFTVGAAGVLAGASFAFGATPAMAAEVSGTPDTKPDVAQTPVTAGENAGTGKKAEAGDKNQTEANKEAGYKAENTNKQAEQKSENTVNTDGTENKSTVVKIRGKRSVDNPPSGHTATVQDRASGGSAGQDPNKINPDTTDTSNTKIDINENNAETMPNAYAWGSSDNTYSVDGSILLLSTLQHQKMVARLPVLLFSLLGQMVSIMQKVRKVLIFTRKIKTNTKLILVNIHLLLITMDLLILR